MSADLKSKITSFTSGGASLTVRLFVVGFLGLILFIPLVMIQEVIYERENYYRQAQDEVMSKWGQRQTVTGPILTVPFSYKEGQNTYYASAHLVPESVTITGNVEAEVRSRGIFDILLYNSTLHVEGIFPMLSSVEELANKSIHTERVQMSVGLSDVSGLKKETNVKWGKQTFALKPSQAGYDRGNSYALESAPFKWEGPVRFAFDLELRGGESLLLATASKQTSVQLTSNWPHPQFAGSILPSERTLKDDGFTAEWTPPPFIKGVPLSTTGTDSSESYINLLNNAAFGVDLFYPVDFYQQTTRSVKYGALFIILSFVSFFLFEVITKLRVHPFQYLLVGAALCVFYLLLLSLSEHIAFGWAYLVAAAATVLLVVSYCAKVLSSRKRAGMMGGILTVLYTYLYFTLQSTDYALLAGSVLLFAVLALLMYLTRNIDWYNTGR